MWNGIRAERFAGGVDALFEQRFVTELIGKQQHQARIELRALLLGEALMRGDQALVKRIVVGEVEGGLHLMELIDLVSRLLSGLAAECAAQRGFDFSGSGLRDARCQMLVGPQQKEHWLTLAQLGGQPEPTRQLAGVIAHA